ncbi:MAG: hypothetical protein ACYC9Z_17895 [Casimicrobiaceae bacterium]
MIPIVNDPNAVALALAGDGALACPRLHLLLAGGARDIAAYADRPSTKLRERAGSALMRLCDFRNPAEIRRAELLLTVSTEGVSPGTPQQIREHLETTFTAIRAERLNQPGKRRQRVRAQGRTPREVGDFNRAVVTEEGWLG